MVLGVWPRKASTNCPELQRPPLLASSGGGGLSPALKAPTALLGAGPGLAAVGYRLKAGDLCDALETGRPFVPRGHVIYRLSWPFSLAMPTASVVPNIHFEKV